MLRRRLGIIILVACIGSRGYSLHTFFIGSNHYLSYVSTSFLNVLFEPAAFHTGLQQLLFYVIR